MVKCKLLFLIFVVLQMYSGSSYGLKLTPSNFELKPKGSGSSYVFDIENDQKQVIAVQVNIMTRELDENGKEINKDANSLFEVFPSQIILPENATKKTRIRWLGEKNIDSEMAFRLNVSQLPVSFSKEKEDSAVKVLHSVVAALYVTPPSVTSKLSIENAVKNGGRLNFLVRDSGGKHSLLSEHEITIKGDREVVIDANAFSNLPTQNVLANSQLMVDIPWPQEAGEKLESIKIK